MYQKSYNIIYSDSLHIPDFWRCEDYYKTQKLETVCKLCNEQSIKGENPLHCILREPFGWTVLLFFLFQQGIDTPKSKFACVTLVKKRDII